MEGAVETRRATSLRLGQSPLYTSNTSEGIFAINEQGLTFGVISDFY
jgi:hypothetical protein